MNPPITQGDDERQAQVNNQYGLVDPEWPLREWGMGRFDAEELVVFALDKAGVPKHADDGQPLTLMFRCRWLASACEEARRG